MVVENPEDLAANVAGLSRSQKREQVKQEQRDINEANAGKVDADGNEFVPLVVDGIDGPLTEAAREMEGRFFMPTPSGETGGGETGETGGETGGEDGADGETPKETAAEKKLREDNEALRNKLNASQQTAIDARLKNEALQLQNQENSMDVLADLVRTYGLPDSITEFLSEQMIEGESELGIAQKIRARPEYAARFPGMGVRRDLKLPAISEAEYVRLERDYRSIMRAANLPATFHDAPEDFTNLISGDVSAQEFQQRVTLAESARDTANQDIVNELKDLYNLSDGDLTAYYLDPKLAENIFEERRKYEAAGLSAASMQAVGEGLEVQTAEALQRESVQRREIQSRMGQRAGLTEDLLGSEGLSATDIAEAEFNLDVDEAAKLRRRREGRLAPMMGRGSTLTTASGITGLGAADS
jgi:hypothetical protein